MLYPAAQRKGHADPQLRVASEERAHSPRGEEQHPRFRPGHSSNGIRFAGYSRGEPDGFSYRHCAQANCLAVAHLAVYPARDQEEGANRNITLANDFVAGQVLLFPANAA